MKTDTQHEPWYAAGDPWVLTQTSWAPDRNFYFETIFTQSNGYLGIRGYTEEKSPRMATCREGYLAGVFGHINEAALKQIRVNYEWPMLSMVTLPELFACDITLKGETFHLAKGAIVSFRRSLDMRNGVLTRDLVWQSAKGRRTRLQFERFLSAAVPHLALQRITVTPENWSGQATVKFRLAGDYPTYFRCGDRSFPHPPQDILTQPVVTVRGAGDASLTVTTKGTEHVISLASLLTGGVCESADSGKGDLEQIVTLTLAKGVAQSLGHSVAVVSSRDDVEAWRVPERAASLAHEAQAAGYHAVLADSSRVWAQRWEVSDVAIDGPARDQAFIRFSAFSLLQMAPFHTANMSVPARAYAYNRYHGLYYWDSETFLMPPYLHTHPKVAEHLLTFRHRTLDGARRTAQQLKSPGACFPWMTDSDDGTEQAPWGIGDYVWHQNADIAYAIDQYVRTTGDTAFMVEKGLEVIVESARFWMSRLEEDAAGVVHLHNTVGPDELDNHGKDNGYTSLMARRHLRLAARWVDSLKASNPAALKALLEKLELRPGEMASWNRAADRLAAPLVPGHNFPLQDEFLLAKKPLSFEGMTADEAFAMRHTHRVVKQADIVLVMCLLQDEFTVDQMREAYDFYEPMTLHYSSLSYNTHSILATKIGRDDVAYDYFMKAAGLDLDDLRGATKDGLHAAALGGTWNTIAYGFMGMRLLDEAMALDPKLPAAWKSIALKIVYQGHLLELALDHEKVVILVRGAGGRAGAKLIVGGETHDLRDGLRIESTAVATK